MQNMKTDVKRTIIASPDGPRLVALKSELSLNDGQTPVLASYIVQQQLLFTSVVALKDMKTSVLVAKYCILSFFYKIGFSFQNNPKDLDLSCKTYLDTVDSRYLELEGTR